MRGNKEQSVANEIVPYQISKALNEIDRSSISRTKEDLLSSRFLSVVNPVQEFNEPLTINPK
jgi:hypothetical protein